MSALRKVHFVVTARFPTEKAYGVNIDESARAMSKHAQQVSFTASQGRGRWNSLGGFEYRENRLLRAIAAGSRFRFNLLRGLAILRAARPSAIADVAWTRDALAAIVLSWLSSHVVLELHQPPNDGVIALLARTCGRRRVSIFYSSDSVRRTVAAADSRLNGPVFGNGVQLDATERPSEVSDAIEAMQSSGLRVLAIAGRPESAGRLKGWSVLGRCIQASLLPRDVVILVFGGNAADVALAYRTLDPDGRAQASGRLLVLNGIAHEKVPTALAKADALLLVYDGSSNEHSPSPLKALEYAASGTPIVASRTENVQSILPANAALFFEVDDEVELVKQITVALAAPHSQVVNERVENARALASESTWDQRCFRLLDWLGYEKA